MENILLKLNQLFLKHDNFKGIPNTDDEIIKMEEILNIKFNLLFKNIIKNYGSCFVGIPIYSFHKNSFLGNDTLIDLNNSFREISSNYLSNKLLAISHDGCGNYLLIEELDDNLYLYDHEAFTIEKFYGGTLSEIISDFVSNM